MVCQPSIPSSSLSGSAGGAGLETAAVANVPLRDIPETNQHNQQFIPQLHILTPSPIVLFLLGPVFLVQDEIRGEIVILPSSCLVTVPLQDDDGNINLFVQHNYSSRGLMIAQFITVHSSGSSGIDWMSKLDRWTGRNGIITQIKHLLSLLSSLDNCRALKLTRLWQPGSPQALSTNLLWIIRLISRFQGCLSGRRMSTGWAISRRHFSFLFFSLLPHLSRICK